MELDLTRDPVRPYRRSYEHFGSRHRPRLVSGSFALVLVAALCMETSFFLLVSVTPMAAAADGANSTGAGLVTGVLLLGTVVAELASPVLMRRCGHRVTLAAGALLMGVPLLVLLAHGAFVITMIASLARGFGFGLGAVVLGALVPLLVPADRRGEGLALSGVVETIPGVVALPAGVWLAGHAGFGLVVIVAAVTALVPAAATAWLPRGSARGDPGAASDQDRPVGLLAGLRQAGQRRPALIFAASTVAAGVVGLVPAAGHRAVAQHRRRLPVRTGADRHGGHAGGPGGLATGSATRVCCLPALAIAAAGMAGLFWLASPVAVIAGMGLFGLGFGALQNATFTLMINRMPESGFGTASAIWNLAYDAGYGAGPAAFGVFVGVTGYPIAFAFSALMMVVALPLTRRPRPGAAAPGPDPAAVVAAVSAPAGTAGSCR